jgi:hypothetical protein
MRSQLARYKDDARLDAMIHDATLRHLGIVEPDEPTPWSHRRWMEQYAERARGEFSPAEREQIRAHLGLGPFGAVDA